MKGLKGFKMSNVIAFPHRIKAQQSVTVGKSQAMTLFIQVKRATLIAHLAHTSPVAAVGKASTR